MSDSKLDYGARRTTTGYRRVLARPNSPAYIPDSKLDLPGTLEEFSALAAAGIGDGAQVGAIAAVNIIGAVPYRVKENGHQFFTPGTGGTVYHQVVSSGWDYMLERVIVRVEGTAGDTGLVTVRVDDMIMDATDFTVGPQNTTFPVADEASPIYAAKSINVDVLNDAASAGAMAVDVFIQYLANPKQ